MTAPTREAAEAIELDLKLRRRLGDLYIEPPTTVGDEIASYLEWKRAAGGLSEPGYRFLVQSSRVWARLERTLVPQLRRSTIEDLIAERAAEHPRSALNELQFLKSVLKRAAGRGQRVDERIFAIDPVKVNAREGVALTPAQLEELASWFPEYLQRLPLVAGTVGARLSEWLSLRDDQLELDAKPEPILRFWRSTPGNKSKREKAVPLTQREAQLLREQLLARAPKTALVFPRRHGTQFNPENFRWDYFTPAAIAAGLGGRDDTGHYDGLRFHDLRHTAISLQARAGYRPEWIAERVGHSDGGALILRNYRHLYPSEMTAAAPSLDALFGTADGQEVDTQSADA